MREEITEAPRWKTKRASITKTFGREIALRTDVVDAVFESQHCFAHKGENMKSNKSQKTPEQPPHRTKDSKLPARASQPVSEESPEQIVEDLTSQVAMLETQCVKLRELLQNIQADSR